MSIIGLLSTLRVVYAPSARRLSKMGQLDLRDPPMDHKIVKLINALITLTVEQVNEVGQQVMN